MGEHVLEAHVLRVNAGGGLLDDGLGQAQPLRDGKGVGLAGDADEQAVGGGQGCLLYTSVAVERRACRCGAGDELDAVVALHDLSLIHISTFRREGGYADGRHPDAVDFDATLAEDLARRDFTVNAMALDENGMVIDRYGGQTDLFRSVIRCVGDPDRRFAEDALRMLRAVRFAAQLDFSIEKGTLDAIRRSARRAENLDVYKRQGGA